MALSRISAGLLPDSLACTPSRAAVRPSLVPKSVASALMSSFGPAGLASKSAHPLDRLSFRRPHRPLGSAAVTARPAIMGLSRSLVHSSGVKLQGNRANRLCCDEAGEVVVVPCGHLSPEA